MTKPLPYRLLEMVAAGFRIVSKLFAYAASGLRYAGYRLFLHEPRPDDIWIATYPKSGTTLMQMLVYQLSTGGKGEFEHIEDVAPWFEIAAVHWPEHLRRLPSPRILKTHLRPRFLPRNGRVIYVVRNPKDVVVSFYHHARLLGGFQGTLDQFTRRFLRGRGAFGSWLGHVRAWWPMRGDERVLFLRYENICRNLDGAAREIADFCGFTLSAAELAVAVDTSTLQSMKSMEVKFDPRLGPRPPGGQRSRFIRKGVVGGWDEELSASAEALLDTALAPFADKLGLGDDLSGGLGGPPPDRGFPRGPSTRR